MGRTPLHLAANEGFLDIVHTLIDAGANIGAIDYKGETPLQKATVCSQGNKTLACSQVITFLEMIETTRFNK